MTILFDQIVHEFYRDPQYNEPDRAQPISVDPSDEFVVLTQWDHVGEEVHYIMVERRDLEALIEALQRS